jgi:hypothetical protein
MSYCRSQEALLRMGPEESLEESLKGFGGEADLGALSVVIALGECRGHTSPMIAEVISHPQVTPTR